MLRELLLAAAGVRHPTTSISFFCMHYLYSKEYFTWLEWIKSISNGKMCLTYEYVLLEISANERIKLISEGIAVVNF